MPGSSRRRRRLLFAALVLLAGGVGFCVLQPRTAFRILAWAFPRILWRVHTHQPLAALTFDDGPDPVYTPQVLAILARHDLRATFFLIGANARGHPELVARIREAGHAVGNHTDGPMPTALVSTARFEQDLLRAESTLGLGAARPKLFRPASGWIRPAQLEVAERHGYTTVLGSAYPYDPRRPPAAYVRWLVAKNLGWGVIVVLHDSGGDRSRTVAALEGILAAGREKGLRFVTLPELLAAAEE